MRVLVMTGPADGPERTAVREVAVPRPGPGQVSIDVACAGINFIDVMARRGDAGYVPAWPYVPGLEVAGTVRELGAGAGGAGLAVGQRVAAFTPGGGLAKVAVTAAPLVVPLPEAVPFNLAAAAPLMLSAALLLLTEAGRLRAGETVLMHSASGGIGSAVAQLVPLLGGGRRIGTVGRAGQVAGARALGWDVAVGRDGDLAAAVRAAVTGRDGGAGRGAAAGDGVDVILDPLGTQLLDLDLEVAAPGARIVLFGNASGGRPAALPPLGRLIGGNVALAGFSMSRLTAAAPARAAAALRRVLRLLDSGELAVTVTVAASLDEVPAIHQLLADGQGHGKYVAQLP
jgi:NADPH:quinone reductase